MAFFDIHTAMLIFHLLIKSTMQISYNCLYLWWYYIQIILYFSWSKIIFSVWSGLGNLAQPGIRTGKKKICSSSLSVLIINMSYLPVAIDTLSEVEVVAFNLLFLLKYIRYFLSQTNNFLFRYFIQVKFLWLIFYFYPHHVHHYL